MSTSSVRTYRSIYSIVLVPEQESLKYSGLDHDLVRQSREQCVHFFACMTAVETLWTKVGLTPRGTGNHRLKGRKRFKRQHAVSDRENVVLYQPSGLCWRPVRRLGVARLWISMLAEFVRRRPFWALRARHLLAVPLLTCVLAT